MNLITTIIGFGMIATFIVFVCSRLIYGRIRGVGSRQMSEIESRIDLEQNVGAVTSTSTRTPIYKAFAKGENIGDVTAKGECVGNVADLGDILEDPANEPNKDMYMMTIDPEDAPNQPEYVQIGMVSGLPVSVNGKEFSPASLLSELNEIGGEISNMVKNEDSGSPSWSASLFMQTTEDVARAVAAAAAAATTVCSPRPSVVFSSKDDNGNSPLHKLQHQVSRVLKGFSQPPEVKSGTYDPEVLTSQKRQWASVQLQSLDHRPLKEPSKLFESMVVVGLHPNCDIQALQKQYFGRKSEGSGKFRSAFSGQHQSRVEPNLEP